MVSRTKNPVQKRLVETLATLMVVVVPWVVLSLNTLVVVVVGVVRSLVALITHLVGLVALLVVVLMAQGTTVGSLVVAVLEVFGEDWVLVEVL